MQIHANSCKFMCYFDTIALLSWIKQNGTYCNDNLTKYTINIFKLMFSWNKFFITDSDCIYLSQKTLVLTHNVNKKVQYWDESTTNTCLFYHLKSYKNSPGFSMLLLKIDTFSIFPGFPGLWQPCIMISI